MTTQNSQSNALTFQSAKSDRFVYIDALRGLAAMAVVIYHLFHNTMMGGLVLSKIFPNSLELTRWGSNGVQVFFVLSGFVIAYSLRNNALSLRESWNFILRRQIRLDPPYWATLALALVLVLVEQRIPQAQVPELPSLSNILINWVYLADLMRVHRIVGVSWTLGIEIQFYLAFILSLVLCRAVALSLGKNVLKFTAGYILLTGALSIFGNNWFYHEFLFTENWYFFTGGVLCCWVLCRKLPPVFLYWMLGCYALQLVIFLPPVLQFCRENLSFITITAADRVIPIDTPHGLLMGGLALCSIYLVSRAGKLSTALNTPVLQYLGKISYSLYLLHSMVLSAFLRAAYKVTGQNPWMAIIWSVLAIFASIAVAHLLHLWIEKPSMRLASLLRIKHPEPAPSVSGEAVPAPASP